ncbi:MAG: hypothetical protein HRU19_12875 [Pseudobacteriovorax sp.]|nr:hypothetical protein [Pseudobacteriovorax sp.]
MNINRRQMILGSTISSLLLSTPIAVGMSHKDLETYIRDIVYTNFPDTISQPSVVSDFAKGVLDQSLDLLEEESFINEEFKKRDSLVFERFVLVQFTSFRKTK